MHEVNYCPYCLKATNQILTEITEGEYEWVCDLCDNIVPIIGAEDIPFDSEEE